MKKTAIGIIDAQRGFMPRQEWMEGYDELPITDGDLIVTNVNSLLKAEVDVVFTTQDWHPESTAHFSENPDYNTTWPVHCVADTLGAELHHNIKVPKRTWAFKKGMDALSDGADDTSYSGYNASIRVNGEDVKTLPELLAEKNITRLILGGLALDYCVKATALDFAEKTDMEVIVALDATKPVDELSGHQATTDMQNAGIQIVYTDEALRLVQQT